MADTMSQRAIVGTMVDQLAGRRERVALALTGSPGALEGFETLLNRVFSCFRQ